MAWFVKYFWNVLFLTGVLIVVASAVTSSDRYIINANIFVDNAAYKKYREISGKSRSSFRREINAFFVDVSDLLGSLKEFNVSIDIRINRLILLTKDFLPVDPWNEKIGSSKALKSFYKWITNKSNSKYQDYDLTLFFTGYRFYRGMNGYSYPNSVCKPQATGIITYSGNYDNVITTAHEIGHMIGAHHDGGGHAPSCLSSKGYIMMNPTRRGDPNQFHFSTCSATSIKATMDKLTNDGENCLTNKTVPIGHKGQRLGALLSPDQVCRREFRREHGAISKAAFSALGENICIKLPCTYKGWANKFYISYVDTPQGIKCATGKECVQGKCVPKQN